MLGKLQVQGHPTYLDCSRARAYCACNRCGLGLFGLFFSHLSLLFSFSLSLGDGPILTEILSQRAVKSRTTNHVDPVGWGVVGWCDGAGSTSSTGASYNWITVGQAPTALAVSAVGGCLDFGWLVVLGLTAL